MSDTQQPTRSRLLFKGFALSLPLTLLKCMYALQQHTTFLCSTKQPKLIGLWWSHFNHARHATHLR